MYKKGETKMNIKTMKLQIRPHTAAISIPLEMLPRIGNGVKEMDVRQYSDGRITLTPVRNGE